MKKYILVLLALFLTTISLNSYAFTAPAAPIDNSYVVDQSGKLSAVQIEQLNRKIENLNKTTRNEYGVLIISSLEGSSIEEAAQEVFRTWGIGKEGLNNGILLMISTGERKTRIHTGKGVEGDLPDLRANDILNQVLKPHLKKGDFYGGIDATLDKTSSYIESRHNASTSDTSVANSTSTTSGDSDGGAFVAFIVLMLCGFGLFVLIISFFSRRKSSSYSSSYSYPSSSSYSSSPYSSPTRSSSSSWSSSSSSSSSSGSYGGFGGGDSGGGGSSGDY